jgi:hypothetical protein
MKYHGNSSNNINGDNTRVDHVHECHHFRFDGGAQQQQVVCCAKVKYKHAQVAATGWMDGLKIQRFSKFIDQKESRR